MNINDLFKAAHKRFGQKTVDLGIIGSTGYWDKMKIEEGSYAFVDRQTREGVVVAIDIFNMENVLVSQEVVSCFRRYSQGDGTRRESPAVGFGEHRGPGHLYAMGLSQTSQKDHSPLIERWIELIEKGFVEYEHIYHAGEKGEKFKYVLREQAEGTLNKGNTSLSFEARMDAAIALGRKKKEENGDTGPFDGAMIAAIKMASKMLFELDNKSGWEILEHLEKNVRER